MFPAREGTEVPRQGGAAASLWQLSWGQRSGCCLLIRWDRGREAVQQHLLLNRNLELCLCFQALSFPGHALSSLHCLPWLFGNPNCSHTMTPTQMTVIHSECFHLNYVSRHSVNFPTGSTTLIPGKEQPEDLLSLLNTFSVSCSSCQSHYPNSDRCPYICHPPATADIQDRNLLSVSKPEPTAQNRKAWLLPGNPWALCCFSLGSFGLMQTRFLRFSCCKYCSIPGCQEPTVPTAAKTEQGVNFDRMTDCLLIKDFSTLYLSWDPNQKWAILPRALNG